MSRRLHGRRRSCELEVEFEVQVVKRTVLKVLQGHVRHVKLSLGDLEVEVVVSSSILTRVLGAVNLIGERIEGIGIVEGPAVLSKVAKTWVDVLIEVGEAEVNVGLAALNKAVNIRSDARLVLLSEALVVWCGSRLGRRRLSSLLLGVGLSRLRCGLLGYPSAFGWTAVRGCR